MLFTGIGTGTGTGLGTGVEGIFPIYNNATNSFTYFIIIYYKIQYQKVYQDAISALPPFGEGNKAKEAELKEEMNAAIVIALGDLAERTKELEKRRASLPTADGFGDLQ